MNDLAEKLGHTSEQEREQVARILRAAMHSIRDSIDLHENLHVIAQLPMALKALYVDRWEPMEKPHRPRTIEDFKELVKAYQRKYGEQNFNWHEGTDQIFQTVMKCLRTYISTGEAIHIMDQLPKEVKELIV